MEKFLEVPLTKIPMEVLVGIIKRCMEDVLSVFQKHSADEFPKGILGIFQNKTMMEFLKESSEGFIKEFQINF